MRQRAKHTKLYEYLERTNALSGTDAEIQAAIREYRKQYKAEWRRCKRESNQEITATFNPHELHVIETAARKHRRSRARFLKEAALAYCNKAYVVPDVLLINSIWEKLAMTGAEIHRHFEDGSLPYNAGKEILKRIDALEAEIMNSLRNPESLEERILDEVRKNPAYKETILRLLKSMDA